MKNSNNCECCLGNKPVLSIIVPSYKTEKFMDQCLPHFISDYLFGKIEVLLIDDGSPDDSLKKAEEYESKFPKIFKAIHKSNGGHGSVINFGLKIAKGKFFKVVDGDDYLDTKSLEQLVNYLSNSNVDCVVTDYVIFDDSSEKIMPCKKDDIGQINSYIYTIHSVTYKTEIFQKNKISVREHCFYEDNEYCAFPLPFIKTIQYLDLPLYHYRLGQDGQSVSPKTLWKNRENLWLVYKDIINYESSLRNLSSPLKNVLDDILAVMFITGFSMYIASSLGPIQASKKIKELEKPLRENPDVLDLCSSRFKKYRAYKLMQRSWLAVLFLRLAK